jgi:hypothetical protein
MVSLLNKVAVFPTGMFDFNASQDGRYGWFLLTWHPESDPVLEEIQTQIKLDIRNSALGQTSALEIENWLKHFFAEYHWKLHAVFRKTSLREKGISLLLAVLFDHDLYIVEFGRMLCGRMEKDRLEPVGRSWNNFHVKSLEEMTLLGMSEADIPVKVKRFHLAENNRFIALPSILADRLMELDVDYGTLDTLMQPLAEECNGSYFILEGRSKAVVRKRPRLRRYQISAVVIILLSLFALAYMQFGNRWLESTGRKIKLLLTSKNRLTVEQIPQYLNIRSQSLRQQIRKIEQFANQPARHVKLEQSWQTDLNFLITAVPAFDIDNIYIVSENKLMAYDKDSKKLVWKKEFASNVDRATVIRGRLLVFLDNRQIVALKQDDKVAWVKTASEDFRGEQLLAPVEISSEDDPRLNGSILILPTRGGLYVYDVNSGNLLSSLRFDRHLQYLSRYDAYHNCFYAVVDDGVYCISLDVFN